jgi:hypothetical protein
MGKRINALDPLSSLQWALDLEMAFDKSGYIEAKKGTILDFFNFLSTQFWDTAVRVGLGEQYVKISDALAAGNYNLLITSDITEDTDWGSHSKMITISSEDNYYVNFTVGNSVDVIIYAKNVNFRAVGVGTKFTSGSKFVLSNCEISGTDFLCDFGLGKMYADNMTVNMGNQGLRCVIEYAGVLNITGAGTDSGKTYQPEISSTGFVGSLNIIGTFAVGSISDNYGAVKIKGIVSYITHGATNGDVLMSSGQILGGDCDYLYEVGGTTSVIRNMSMNHLGTKSSFFSFGEISNCQVQEVSHDGDSDYMPPATLLIGLYVVSNDIYFGEANQKCKGVRAPDIYIENDGVSLDTCEAFIGTINIDTGADSTRIIGCKTVTDVVNDGTNTVIILHDPSTSDNYVDQSQILKTVGTGGNYNTIYEAVDDGYTNLKVISDITETQAINSRILKITADVKSNGSLHEIEYNANRMNENVLSIYYDIENVIIRTSYTHATNLFFGTQSSLARIFLTNVSIFLESVGSIRLNNSQHMSIICFNEVKIYVGDRSDRYASFGNCNTISLIAGTMTNTGSGSIDFGGTVLKLLLSGTWYGAASSGAGNVRVNDTGVIFIVDCSNQTGGYFFFFGGKVLSGEINNAVIRLFGVGTHAGSVQNTIINGQLYWYTDNQQFSVENCTINRLTAASGDKIKRFTSFRNNTVSDDVTFDAGYYDTIIENSSFENIDVDAVGLSFLNCTCTVDTITINSGADKNLVSGCRTVNSIVDNGADNQLVANYLT